MRRGSTPHDHFDYLLGILLLEFVVTGIADSPLTRLLAAVLYFAAVVLAVRTTGARMFRFAPRVIAFGVVGLAAVVLAPADGSSARGWAAVCGALVGIGVLLAVLGRIVRHDHVSLQTIAGALCAYLLIGFVFASVYAALDRFGSAPLFGKPVDAPDYSYFSFVTLTTTGFGDLAPTTDLGRRIVILEAIAGQIFLATMVARLVALFRPTRERPTGP